MEKRVFITTRNLGLEKIRDFPFRPIAQIPNLVSLQLSERKCKIRPLGA
jgi:hypothetical protein